MCWRTNYGILIKQHTASKDIPVKKAFLVTDHGIRSPFYSDFSWVRGVLQKSYLGVVRRFYINGSEPRRYMWIIEEGFHSAKSIRIGYKKACCRLRIGDGEYTMIMSYCKPNAENIQILNCIIPKGSRYNLNERGEYVSDQLLILPNQ